MLNRHHREELGSDHLLAADLPVVATPRPAT